MKLLIGIFTFFSIAANAAEIGPAGCGFGNVIFGKDDQILASTTNDTSGSQTFGITSGTSNCDQSNHMARLEGFIEDNRMALNNDIARGQGETITGISEILGCQDDQGLANVLKGNYKTLFSRVDKSSRELANGIHNTVRKNSLTCGNT